VVISALTYPKSSSASRFNRRVGEAFATEAVAECIRSSGVWEAESNIELLGLVSTPAAADGDASVTVERINL
jgi:hypothetical protein